MGGLNSEIKGRYPPPSSSNARTSTATSIRSTSKKLALRTEASSRFEKGIDPNLCETAADRVCRLIEMLGAGTVTKGSVDIYPVKPETYSVNVRVDRVNKVLGTDIIRAKRWQTSWKALRWALPVSETILRSHRLPSVRTCRRRSPRLNRRNRQNLWL